MTLGTKKRKRTSRRLVEAGRIKESPVQRSRKARGGFDFTAGIGAVCCDMVRRLSELHHIDMRQVAVSFSQTRHRATHGLHATLTPMRFEGGQRTGIRRDRRYAAQQILDEEGQEFLYILSFYLPRFMDVPLTEKLTTILHELWHISPQFDGDIRRHPGRCYAHAHSQKEYDEKMARLADRWLSLAPPEDLYAFLRHDFDELHRRYGGVFGVRIPQPKLIPVDDSAAM